MSCQAAIPLGAQAANTVLARIAGTDPAGVNQAMFGACVSLGRHGATLQPSHLDDTPLPLYMGGRSVAFVKEQVCQWTLKFLRGEAEKPGSYKWVKGGDRQQQLARKGEAAIR